MTKGAREYTVNDKKNNMSLPARKNRIVVVDDHPVVREGLEQLINREDDLVVCATAGNSKRALETVEECQVDLVIIDMLLKKTTGVQVTEKLRFRHPSLYILILSMSDAAHHVKLAFQARIARQCSKKTIASWILETDTNDALGKV
jgi:DNA-binding NarL/FixJ family response regulator